MKKWMILAAAILVVLGIGFAVKGASDKKQGATQEGTAVPETTTSAPNEATETADPLREETETEDGAEEIDTLCGQITEINDEYLILEGTQQGTVQVNIFDDTLYNGSLQQGELAVGQYAEVIYDGKMHPVDSNEISFKLAARNAFKEAFRNAGPKIMEPIYSVEVLVPSEYMGAVMSDLQNRRAMIAGMESDKGFDRLNALVPLAELYRYSTTLSSLTSGSATYSMKFGSYEQVPADVQEKLLKAYTDTDDE